MEQLNKCSLKKYDADVVIHALQFCRVSIKQANDGNLELP